MSWAVPLIVIALLIWSNHKNQQEIERLRTQSRERGGVVYKLETKALGGAAVTELYAACRGYIDWLDDGFNGPPMSLRLLHLEQWVEKMRQALAKAEGN